MLALLLGLCVVALIVFGVALVIVLRSPVTGPVSTTPSAGVTSTTATTATLPCPSITTSTTNRLLAPCP